MDHSELNDSDLNEKTLLAVGWQDLESHVGPGSHGPVDLSRC